MIHSRYLTIDASVVQLAASDDIYGLCLRLSPWQGQTPSHGGKLNV